MNAAFLAHYAPSLHRLADDPQTAFLLCDFRGVDTLAMEFLKCRAQAVTIFHMGERPRYMPDAYRTRVSQWQLAGGYQSDVARDTAAASACTHFLARDANSNQRRKSGTLQNIEQCLALGKRRVSCVLSE